MIIEKIEAIKFLDKNEIVVTLKEYPHAQPIFPSDISVNDLQIQLKAWKIHQDAVDLINNQEPNIEPEPIVNSELKALEGKEVK